MAHFAELDKDGTVLRVIVVDNVDTVKESFKTAKPLLSTPVSLKAVSGKTVKVDNVDTEWEDEAKGIAFCQKLLGGTWIQTSYHGNFRKRFAGTGYTYDKERDAFIEAQPYPSWKLDKDLAWQAPVPQPVDEREYSWDEKTGSWLAV
jgi:hypothetical protein